MTATAVTPTQIHVAWSVIPFVRKADIAFKVERSPDGRSGWTEAGTTDGLSFEDTGLTPNTHYYYRVFGVGTQGISDDHADADERTLLAAPAAGATRLTQAQAMAAAAAFCRTVGAPVTAAGRAEYPAPNEFPNEAEHHWQKRWRVLFPKQAAVEIVDATGAICSFNNLSLGPLLFNNGHLPAGNAIPETDALQRAAAVLQATGQVGELSAPTAYLRQYGNPPTKGSHVWDISWKRQAQGVPYRYQGVNMSLDAETGVVEGFGMTFPSAPPMSVRQYVGQGQAVATAQALLRGIGGQGVAVDMAVRSVGEELVMPNTYWQVGGSESQVTSATARPAWICVFGSSEPFSSRTDEVWVDTETGSVIGGSTFARRGSSLPSGTSRPVSRPKPMVPLAK